MKNAVIFLSGVVVGSVVVPVALITACVVVELRDPSNPFTIRDGEVVVKEEGSSNEE